MTYNSSETPSKISSHEHPSLHSSYEEWLKARAENPRLAYMPPPKNSNIPYYKSTSLEFPLFPWKFFRPNPSFLNKGLPVGMTDPWARRDAWRYHEFFSIKNRFRDAVPGLGIAIVAFSIYVVVDNMFLKETMDNNGHHVETSGKESHH